MSAIDGLPVGAFVVEARHVDSIKRTLRKGGWLKSGVNVTQYFEAGTEVPVDAAASLLDQACPRRAVHVTPVAAAAMYAGGDAIPVGVKELLERHVGCWIPGLRVHGIACSKNRPRPRPSITEEHSFTFSELFAGIGGFRLALDKLGGKCIFTSELDEGARRVYAKNFGDTPCGDILEIDAEMIGPHDLLTGGFPCQPFSNLGEKQGFADARGQLFWEILRVLHQCKPKSFILENVANLLYIDGSASFERILQELSSVGYAVDWRLINSSEVLPQQRLRLYIVGVRFEDGGLDGFRWPELPVLETTLKDLLEGPEVDLDPLFLLSEEQYSKLKRNKDYLHDHQKRLAQVGAKAKTLTSSYRGGIRSEFVFRENAPRPRYFTVRECSRLQGFPEDFVHCGKDGLPDMNRAYHQIGNAVSPVVVAAIAACVLPLIGCRSVAVRQDPHMTIGIEQLPRGPDPHRGLTAPALELLLAASPNAAAKTIRPLCETFLRCEPSGGPSSIGCGRGLEHDDLDSIRRLLASGMPGAQTTALFAIGRVAYLEGQKGMIGAVASLAASGLIQPVVGCLAGVNEVLRQAVTTLKILSAFQLVADLMREDAEALQLLGALAEDAQIGGSVPRQCREILTNIWADTTSSDHPAGEAAKFSDIFLEDI